MLVHHDHGHHRCMAFHPAVVPHHCCGSARDITAASHQHRSCIYPSYQAKLVCGTHYWRGGEAHNVAALHAQSMLEASDSVLHAALHAIQTLKFCPSCCFCRYSAFALAMILSFASVIPIVSICRLAQCAKPSSPGPGL